MKCIRTVSWWHMYTDNMNIHWHQTAHLYLTLQILLVIQYWQSGFQSDCRADAAGALLQFISGFRSPNTVSVTMGPRYTKLLTGSTISSASWREGGSGPSPTCRTSSQLCSEGWCHQHTAGQSDCSWQTTLRESARKPKTLDGQWCHWRDGEQPRSSGEGHRRLEKQSEQSESVLLTQTQVCVSGDTPTTTNLSTKLDMYSVTHCNLL